MNCMHIYIYTYHQERGWDSIGVFFQFNQDTLTRC